MLLVVFKVGRSGAEARSAMSHKGAMAGSNRAYDSLFRQCGAIRAEVFADLLDIPGALVCGRLMRGRRVAVLTSTAGAGTLVADSFGMAGFLLPEPDEGTAGALGALLGSGGYDALVTVVGSSALEDWGEEADHDAERAD